MSEGPTTKQNPFSLYDFLGYLIPGAVFSYSVVGFWGLATRSFAVPHTLHQYLGFDRVELYIPATILAYIAGHILSFLSSITTERYAVRQFGYPSHYLLHVPKKEEQPVPFAVTFFRFAADAFLLPVTLPEQLAFRVGARDHYAKPLDNLLARLLSGKLRPLLVSKGGIEPSTMGNAADHDFFRYVYHYALEHAPNHFTKMQNYVALFGFTRTMSFVAVIDFWLIFFLRLWGKISLPNFLFYSSVFGSCAFFLFLAFSKFYRRFTLEALMAMAVVFPADTGSPGGPGE